MQEENFNENFNYGEISDNDKRVVEEVIKLAKQQGLDIFVKFLEHKFNIVEQPTYDFEESEFVKEAAKNGLFVSVQGTIKSGNKPDDIVYPVISICEDIRKFEKFYNAIKK